MSDGWSPTELLSRLSTKCPQMAMAPGGKPRYAMEDIAGALVGLPFGPYSLARVKYCGDERCLGNLQSEALRRMMIIARRHSWNGKPERFKGCSLVAVDAVLTNSLCRSCKGTGFIRSKACVPCGGSGRRDVGHRRASSLSGISEDSWRKTWAARYKELLIDLQRWDDQIEGHLYHKLIRAG